MQSSRTRGRQDTSERSKRQHKLEELRRRRAGLQTGSEEEDREDSIDENPQSELELITNDMHSTSDLDDFVVDEGDSLGIDIGFAGVPIQFTRHANKKPFEHFKTEIEWMVHNKLNPAFDRYDEIYLLAHNKLDNEAEVYGASKFRSSAWTENFMKALKERPEIYRIDLPIMHDNKCEACNRSGHPSKHTIIFRGKPYNRDTLETITNRDDDDSEDDEETSSNDKSVADEVSFFLGR